MGGEKLVLFIDIAQISGNLRNEYHLLLAEDGYAHNGLYLSCNVMDKERSTFLMTWTGDITNLRPIHTMSASVVSG